MDLLFACDRCNETIGVYEPAVFVVSGDPRETSTAAAPDLATLASERYHRICHAVPQNGGGVNPRR
jgi:hypothetical protein